MLDRRVFIILFEQTEEDTRSEPDCDVDVEISEDTEERIYRWGVNEGVENCVKSNCKPRP